MTALRTFLIAWIVTFAIVFGLSFAAHSIERWVGSADVPAPTSIELVPVVRTIQL